MKESFQEHYEKHIFELEFFINQSKYDQKKDAIFYSLEDHVATCLESLSEVFQY
jgi:hypothetical protein